ncbi:RNA-binding S4 domain-containing protein [bacterium]|nr:RNA-binding S4 domain-containing protein [bacterium]
MRCDSFLKTACLVKSRNIAQELLSHQRVLINGTPAKASREIKQNDQLTIEFPSKTMTIRIIEIPGQKNVSKAQARELYEILDCTETASR